MNTAFERFLQDNNINVSKLSQKVVTMLSPLEDMKTKSNQITSTGGYLRHLSQAVKKSPNQKGGTSLPIEFFGKTSNNYHADVSTINFTDATPQMTRHEILSTFKGGGALKSYKFVSVGELRKQNSNANKEYAYKVNKMLTRVYTRAIKGGGITQKSLINSFNQP
jgi:hypothetical protein